MEEDGARLTAVRGDITRREDVSRILDDIAAGMPPLRGVIHAAGVIDDGVVTELEWSRFESVLAPKVTGAWLLHELTVQLPLDLFVLFSSTASVLGSLGQANYASANAFLDALAHDRGVARPAGAEHQLGPVVRVRHGRLGGRARPEAPQQPGLRSSLPRAGIGRARAGVRIVGAANRRLPGRLEESACGLPGWHRAADC